jgi:DNA-binding response OmpR family regulator
VSEASPDLDCRLYFGRLSVLLMEGNGLESDILSQILSGFKVRSINRFSMAAEARDHVLRDGIDLVVVGSPQAGPGDMDEYDFIRWLRRVKAESSRTAPTILLTGHTSQANVMRARDCGASFVIAKPITPRVLYERIVWLVRDARIFISTDSYAGPDRRFQKLGPPPHTDGRRKDDLSLRVGEAKEPNMSQSEIDALMNARAVPVG